MAAISTGGIKVYLVWREKSAESKSDTIGIHIRSLSLIRIDTYRASGAENMIASSPLSRWVSIGESEGGLMPPSGIHVAFPPSLYPPRFSPGVCTSGFMPYTFKTSLTFYED